MTDTKNDKTPIQLAADKLRSENWIQYKPEHLEIFAAEREELGLPPDASIEDYCNYCLEHPPYRGQECKNWGCPNCAPNISGGYVTADIKPSPPGDSCEVTNLKAMNAQLAQEILYAREYIVSLETVIRKALEREYRRGDS